MFSYLTSILTGLLFRLHTFFSTNLVLIQLNYNKISLWLYDPFREFSTLQHRRHHHYRGYGWNEIERSLDHFFYNDASNQKLQIRDFAGQFIINDKEEFKYRIDVRGFKEDEICVDLDEGSDVITIKAEHKEENENESIQRCFCRKLTLPKDVEKESIKCDLDENGCLIIFATKKNTSENSEKRSIPIEFKKSIDTSSSAADAETNK